MARRIVTRAEARAEVEAREARARGWWTPAELAQRLGVSKNLVLKHIREGLLRALALGKSRRIFEADLPEYLANLARKAVLASVATPEPEPLAKSGKRLGTRVPTSRRVCIPVQGFASSSDAMATIRRLREASHG